MSLTVRELVERYIHLGPPNPSGWRTVLCKVCHDHGRKGDRAAFKFEGEVVGYHCFNCAIASSFDPHAHKRIPKKMIKILESFGIPEDDINQINFNQFSNTSLTSNSNNDTKRSSIDPAEISLPSFFKPLIIDPQDKWTIIAWEYLESRGIKPNNYPFYIAFDDSSKECKKWKGRVIIPIYKDRKLIFYQGRALGNLTKKYENAPTPKDKIIFGFDQLYDNIDKPLYIVEGWFDAFLINGIACFGNLLSDAQIHWLNLSPRKKIVIPDQKGDGHVLANQALELGWAVSVPDIGSDCKDVSQAIEKYGKLFVLQEIAKSTVEGDVAKCFVGLRCQ